MLKRLLLVVEVSNPPRAGRKQRSWRSGETNKAHRLAMKDHLHDNAVERVLFNLVENKGVP